MNIEEIQHIGIADFDYPLPDGRIALHPLAERDRCRLLVARAGEQARHMSFHDLPELLSPGSLMVCNETRVINARIEFHKATGGRIEVFVLEPAEPADYAVSFASTRRCVWTCMIGNLKKWKQEALEKRVTVDGRELTLRARLLPLRDGEAPSASRRVEFSWDNPDDDRRFTFAAIVEAAGNIPIPPYLNRDSEESDLEDYQTVYSRVEGSVAAPTAGLHFTPALFRRLEERGIRTGKVTLHVGAGTFQPVKSAEIGGHPMHTETIHVETSLIEELIGALEAGQDVVAVGTTSVRTLESLPIFGYMALQGADVADTDAMHVSQWQAYAPEVEGADTLTLLKALAAALRGAGLDALSGSTAIMIAPGFKWRTVKRMVTNFHQPQSTLLLLVSSFLEPGVPSSDPLWRRLYAEALAMDYRFLSYGDACLFTRP